MNMASKDRGDIVYTEVDRNNFVKDYVRTEKLIARIVWPHRWGHTKEGHQEIKDALRKGEKVLPHHKCPVKNDFKPFTPDPRYTRPLPKTTNQMYGWKYANSEVHPTYKWGKRIASRHFLNQVNWPYGSQS